MSLLSEKETWDASKWASAWLNSLQKKEWELLRVIIFDRDLKFVDSFWKAIFMHMRVAFHFTTIYHSSSNDQSKRTNQTIKIVIRFSLMNDHTDFVKLLLSIQTTMNNFVNAFTELFSHEIIYEFKILKFLNLLNDVKRAKNARDDNSFTILKKERIILRKEIEEVIIFANAIMKIRYDSTRTTLNLNKEDLVYLRLHKEYNQSNISNEKFSKQRLNSVKILNKIERLVYKLNISLTWKIHSVVFIVHLKSASSEKDSYNKEAIESELVKNVQDDIKDVYELKKILAKRFIKIERSRTLKIQYRVKWKEWDDQHNQWINATKMKNVKKLIDDFESKLSEEIV
jgi:hypothetical protein